jgi:DHA1 family multidrug resistance protein-like MFS transporter
VGGALAFLLLTTPKGFWGLLFASSFFILANAMLRPAISSLTSRRAESGQGVALGLSNSFMSLGRIFGPIWAGFAFDFQMNLPYLTGALLTFAAWIASLIWLTHQEAEGVRGSEMAGAELVP